MVERAVQLDVVFGSLADTTRRDILARLQGVELNVGEVAAPYNMSLAAISKHLKILEQARLIRKRKAGKERLVTLRPEAMEQAAKYIQQYERMWSERLDRLEIILKEES
ncbi:MAG TPA: metalloregulator ArsR/SmtB family transcription factor [Candidatus Saccharimonadales bacterium]|nr:metalloregulator ArsR/SmtB family transcription factor [Candidatus Saccharimonadales bacterium]